MEVKLAKLINLALTDQEKWGRIGSLSANQVSLSLRSRAFFLSLSLSLFHSHSLSHSHSQTHSHSPSSSNVPKTLAGRKKCHNSRLKGFFFISYDPSPSLSPSPPPSRPAAVTLYHPLDMNQSSERILQNCLRTFLAKDLHIRSLKYCLIHSQAASKQKYFAKIVVPFTSKFV